MKKKVLVMVLGLLLLGLISCDLLGEDENAVQMVDIAEDTVEMAEQETVLLTLTSDPVDILNILFTWNSDNSQVATVSTTGEVTGISPGTATITVASKKNSTMSDTVVVTVRELDESLVIRIQQPAPETLEVPQIGVDRGIESGGTFHDKTTIFSTSYIAMVSGIHSIQTNFEVVFVSVKDDFGNNLFGDLLNFYDELTLNFVEGRQYTIRYKAAQTLGDCYLEIYAPNDIIDITGKSSVQDVVRYSKQEIIYDYTTTNEGMYSFQTSVLLYWKIIDTYNNIVFQQKYPDNGLKQVNLNLAENKTYRIVLTQMSNNWGPNTFSVFVPSGAMDISGILKVTDGMWFTSQENVYRFTPSVTGDYRFDVSMDVYWKIADSYQNSLFELWYPKSGSNTKTILLESNRTYIIVLGHEIFGSLGEYTIKISKVS